MKAAATAVQVAKQITKAANAIKPALSFGRKFDSFFENFNGEEVVIEFMKIYYNDEKLQRDTQRVNRWIGIDHWKEIYSSHTNKYPSLF